MEEQLKNIFDKLNKIITGDIAIAERLDRIEMLERQNHVLNNANTGGTTVTNIVLGGTLFQNGATFTAAREAPRTSGKKEYSDKQVADALLNVVGKNKVIDNKQKWAGAYWLLRWECNYPVKPLDFCQKIEQLPFSRELAIKCDYNNIRPLSTLSFMNQDARFPEAVNCPKSEKAVFLQMRSVVIELEKELEKTLSQPDDFSNLFAIR